MNKKILFSAVFIFSLFFASICSAVTLGGMAESFVNNAVWPLAAGVVVTMWVVTGLLFLSAQGAPEKLNSARRSLIWSILGTIIVILAFSAINLIEHSFGI